MCNALAINAQPFHPSYVYPRVAKLVQAAQKNAPSAAPRPHVLPSMRQRAGAVFDEAKPPASPSEAGDAS